MFRKLTRGVALLTALSISLSGLGFSPAQANVPVPTDGDYVCTTGALRAGGDETTPTYTISAGVVTSGGNCAGALVIPDGVTSIGNDAFIYAQGLTSINIPSGVTSIGDFAFYGTTGLSALSIPASVTSIGIYAISETAVAIITVDSANPNYASQAGVLFNKALTTLIAYPSGNTATSYVVPSSVTTIENSSFYRSLFLKSIAIPNSVTSILGYAFSSSPNLETVTFASGSPITEINSETFAALPKLSSIELPSNIVRIGDLAFLRASALTSITIPASVTTIGEYAFEEAYALIDFNFLGNAPTTIAANGFASIASGAKAHIKASATGFGAPSAPPWTWNGLIVQADLKEVSYNSASGSAVASGVLIQGGSIQAAPVSTRAGYTLAGWSATANGSVLTFPYTPTADITLHAIWTRTTTPLTTPPKTAIASYSAKFPAGSSSLTKDGKAAIKKIVRKSGKDAKYTVTGVASKMIGVSDSRVKGLAKARAEKVKAYLIKLGVKKSNIKIKVKILESGITPKTKILAKYLTM